VAPVIVPPRVLSKSRLTFSVELANVMVEMPPLRKFTVLAICVTAAPVTLSSPVLINPRAPTSEPMYMSPVVMVKPFVSRIPFSPAAEPEIKKPPVPSVKTIFV